MKKQAACGSYDGNGIDDMEHGRTINVAFV